MSRTAHHVDKRDRRPKRHLPEGRMVAALRAGRFEDLPEFEPTFTRRTR